MFVYCADYVKKHSFLHRCAFLLHFKKVDYQVGKKEKHLFFLILISSPYFLALEKKKNFFFSKPPFPFKEGEEILLFMLLRRIRAKKKFSGHKI